MAETPSFYRGDNIHSYTSYIRERQDIVNKKLHPYERTQFLQCWQEAVEKYYSNTSTSSDNNLNNIKNGLENILATSEQLDQEVQDLHIGQLFQNIWKRLLEFNEPSMFSHFKETIEQIGNTCIQGVSHRLFEDAIVLFFLDEK
jgi:hypothetical protein